MSDFFDKKKNMAASIEYSGQCFSREFELIRLSEFLQQALIDQCSVCLDHLWYCNHYVPHCRRVASACRGITPIAAKWRCTPQPDSDGGLYDAEPVDTGPASR